MKFDILTLAFVLSLTFVTQVIVLFLQYRVDRTYRGIRWWVLGSLLMAFSVIFMSLVTVKSLMIFAIFANPLMVLGQIFLYIGIMRFIGIKEEVRLLILIFVLFIFSYFYFIFLKNSISERTVIINVTLATISIMTACKLFLRKDKHISESANFTSGVFLCYGCFLIVRASFALIFPPMNSYSDQETVLILGFIIPIFTSSLWTFGFIIMLNQRLNSENRLEKEKIQQLIEQLEIERNTAQLNSFTDSLTGIFNRRYLDEALETEFYRLKRSKSILSIIMIDVDNFKNFNDTYGHLAGDDCLSQIGNILRTTVSRVADIAARYGGEEFIVVLPETSSNGAKTLAERLRKAVEGLTITHATSDTSKYVTISLGIATISVAKLDSPKQIVALADEALYYAKKSGRNRIEVSDSGI